MSQANSHVRIYRVTPKSIESISSAVIGETRWTLFVNGHELVTFMATPQNLHHLAVGFLATEGFIHDRADIGSVRVNLSPESAYWYIPALGVDEIRPVPICESGAGSIHIRLRQAEFRVPSRRIITSGCGGGTTFDDLSGQQTPVTSDRRIGASRILQLMQSLYERGTLYRESRGVHTSALSDGDHIVSIAEDVGRHNTLDKIRGDCLLRGIDTSGLILLSTGRISSEMITKAAKMNVPIVISRTSATSLAMQLAEAWNISLVGYATAGQLLVYSGVERIISE